MSQSYFYQTEAEWITGKDLKLSSSELPAIAGGAPPEFDGRKENWSPEHLFVASMNSCYALTLLAIVEFSKISVVSLSCTARGKLEKTAAGYQVTEIIVKPRVVIASAGDLTRMPRILERPRRIASSPTRSKAPSPSSPRSFIDRTRVRPAPSARQGYRSSYRSLPGATISLVLLAPPLSFSLARFSVPAYPRSDCGTVET